MADIYTAGACNNFFYQTLAVRAESAEDAQTLFQAYLDSADNKAGTYCFRSQILLYMKDETE